MWIVLGLLAWPLVEIALFVTLGAKLGLWLTLAWVQPRNHSPAQVALELATVTVFQIFAPSRAWPHYQVYLALAAYLLILYPDRRYLLAGVFLWWAGAFSGVIASREWEIPFRYTLSTWGVPTLVMLAIWAVLVRALLSRWREGLPPGGGNSGLNESSLVADPGSPPGGVPTGVGAALSAGFQDPQ